MAQGIEAITTAALALALDAASLRQQAIAANIANADRPDYVPMTVDFEAQLGHARRTLESQGHLDAHSLDGVVPRMMEEDTAGRVTLDLEVAALAQNAVHYEALVKGLSKHFALLSEAVSDGQK